MVKLQKSLQANLKLLTLTLITTLAGYSSASDQYVGEYVYKPPTTDDFACEVASDRAKENLIIAKVGLTLTHATEQSCTNEKCTTDSHTLKNVDAEVSKINQRKVEKFTLDGSKVCRVTISGEAKKVVSKIQLNVLSNLLFYHNDVFRINIVSNTSGGDLILFNLYNDTYVRVYDTKKVVAYQEISIPETGIFRATLPEDVNESAEKLVILQVFDNVNLKSQYTIQEMDLLLKTMPKDRYGFMSKFIKVRRSS